jgi:hypothetical protein
MGASIIAHENELDWSPTAPASNLTWLSKMLSMYRWPVNVPLFSTTRFVHPSWCLPAPLLTHLRSCSEIFVAWKRSPRLLQTLAHLSVKSRQNLDSTVNRTCLQCCMVHRACSMVHSKWTWRCFKRILLQGLLDRKLPSCSLLHVTVCVEHRPLQHYQGHFEVKLLSKPEKLSQIWTAQWNGKLLMFWRIKIILL